ncbi:MAG: hypothetical protein HW384_1551, partial [Dehalococcoidia bacterium]|nr:hypothetical protein [Dehalococcoidia bacterium]
PTQETDGKQSSGINNLFWKIGAKIAYYLTVITRFPVQAILVPLIKLLAEFF